MINGNTKPNMFMYFSQGSETFNSVVKIFTLQKDNKTNIAKAIIKKNILVIGGIIA
jgi:hypothetical protein